MNSNLITGAVLAGGHGRRMGAPKAGVLLKGRPLLDYVLDAIGPVTHEIIVVRSARLVLPPINQANATVILDETADEGPLRALNTAFNAARTGLVLAVGCDMPFLNPTLISRLAALIDDFDAVVPIVDGRQQPLHAIYRAAPAAAAAASALSTGDRRMGNLLPRLRTRWVERDEWEAVEPTARSFFNVNTPADLLRATSLA